MAVLPPDPVFVLRSAENAAANSLCFHQNERLLCGTISGKIYLWDLQTNRSYYNFIVGDKAILSMHHTEDMLIVQEKYGTISLWLMSNSGYKQHFALPAQHAGFCRSALCTNSDEKNDLLLFYPCDENSIGVLNVNDTATPPQMLVPNDQQLPKLGTISCLKPFSYGMQTYVLAGYESGHFLTWDIGSGMVIDTLKLEPEPMAVDYNVAANMGVIGGPSDTLYTISYKRQSMQLQKTSDIPLKNAGISSVRIRDDHKVFVTGGWDGRVRIFSCNSFRQLAVLTEHKPGAISDIMYSTGVVSMWKAPIMAVAGNSKISLWDLYNSK